MENSKVYQMKSCKHGRNPDGSICYIIGVRKDIQKEMQRYPGDTITVTIQEIS